jgi:hypothetical protein
MTQILDATLLDEHGVVKVGGNHPLGGARPRVQSHCRLCRFALPFIHFIQASLLWMLTPPSWGCRWERV